MISASAVSFVLTSIWIFCFFSFRRKLFTSKWYFYLLFIMSTAGLFLNLDHLLFYITQKYLFVNIILFALLLLLVLFPWIKYDYWLKNVRFVVNDENIWLLKIVYKCTILLSVCCVIYCLPYAVQANLLGAEQIRTSEGGLLPPTFLTTVATGVATIAPIGLLLFFVSLLDYRLHKYTFYSLIIPFAGIIHSMACAARELYIFLPVTFLILYTAFSNSISIDHRRLIKRIMFVLGTILISIFLIITIDRFGEVGSDYFIKGTWGYIYQQPYVFDQTLQFFDNYNGFSKNLKFIGNLLDLNTFRPDLIFKMERSFGTQYKAFYEMYGYSSLFTGTFIYIFFFTLVAKKTLKNNNVFSILVNFTLFVWFTVSGLFYFRYGVIDSQFLLYLFMILFSSLYPDFLKLENVGDLDDTEKK